ncbi:MAG TPA: PIN domain-containing protein [Dehalococcoidia bacterium]|nr:PIN domain-containing protein [Dehalococcoidia bacterium]
MTPGEPGVLDTSVLIAAEQNRPLRARPSMAAVSVVTLAELYLGVLMADNPEIRARRLETLVFAESQFEPLPIDARVARVFAEIVAAARREGRRPAVNDAWIAATAVANDLPVYTKDDDFRAIPRVRSVLV